MATGSDEEAAYFALLRAREELASLRRYEEYLSDERQRLRRFATETRTLAEAVDARFRRVLQHTRQPLEDALQSRLRVVQDELLRMPDRIEAAEAYVRECEDEHEQLRRSA